MTIAQNIGDTPGLLQELERWGQISIKHGRAVVSIIGEGVRQEDGLAISISDLLKKINVPVDIISQNPKKINLAFIIDQTHIQQTIESLHKVMFEDARDGGNASNSGKNDEPD